MTQGEAILFTAACVMAFAIALGFAVGVMCLYYEIQARLEQRRRPGVFDWTQIVLDHRERRGF